MAYTAQKKADGNYEVFEDGNRITTGTSAILSRYGLSEANLEGAGTPISRPGEQATGASTPFYGYERNLDWEEPARTQVKFTREEAGEVGFLSESFINSHVNTADTIAFFVNAIAYGGYQIGDIVNEMKRMEMVYNGDPDAKKMKQLIHPEMTKKVYMTTADGQNAYREAATVLPTFQLAGGLDPEILNYGLDMPDAFFDMLTPLLDMDSEEFKNAVEDVKSAFYDLTSQQLQAKSEQEKSVADYNYDKFKEEIERQYGIALSDDATKAWAQIEGLEESFTARGISGSGLESEAVDTTLRDMRKQDQRLRQERLTKEEAEKASYYTSSATPEQIQALIDEDKAKGIPQEEWRATKWGLVPSADIVEKYSMENLRARYPDQSDEYLQSLRDEVVDKNNNYRSGVYSKYYADISKNKAKKQESAETVVLQSALDEEKRDRRNLEAGQQSFSVATPRDDTQIKDLEKDELPTGVDTYSSTEPVEDTKSKIDTSHPWEQNQSTEQRKASYEAAGVAASKVGVTPPQPKGYSSYTQKQKDLYQRAVGLIPKKEPTSTGPPVLSSSQQDEYYKSQKTAAKPLSPIDWYKQKYGG
jgi:hypothetical protein